MGITEKSLLYADNMLVYLADPKKSLESFLGTVDMFGLYSGLRADWAKSVLYPVDDASVSEISAKSNFLVVDQFTYLGIVVHRDVHLLESLNLFPTMQYIANKLKEWESLPVTLVGRINVFKMVLHPRLLYLYRASPHILPKAHF